MRPSVKLVVEPLGIAVVGATLNWVVELEVFSVRQPRYVWTSPPEMFGTSNKIELPEARGCARRAPLGRMMSSTPVRLPLTSAVKLPEYVTGPSASKPENRNA